MALKFDVRKYKDDGQILVDGSDSLANQAEQVISFQNIRNDQDIFFKAFITAFNETYTPNFNPTEVFGRTDPIQQYKGTTRNITLAWKLPAASESEAYENLGRVQKLLQMLYPSYLDLSNALTLSEAPLVRLKVMNLLIRNPKNSQDSFRGKFNQDEFSTKLFAEYKSTNSSGNGILGVITSCTINHNLESADGVFQKTINYFGEDRLGENTILPKLIDVNISFTPLHEQTLGYSSETENFKLFPYGVRLGDTDIKKRIVEQGKTLEELREIKKTLEEKRRAAASAQQNLDKQKAALRKAKRKAFLLRGGGDSDRAADKELLERTLDSNDAYFDSVEAQRQSELYEDQFEDLI